MISFCRICNMRRIRESDFVTYDRDGRLTSDGSRNVTAVTYQSFGNLPRRITMGNGDFTQSDYMPDGTLCRRTFSSRKVETVTTINAAGDTIVKTRNRTQTAVHTYSGQFEKTPDGLIYHTGAGHYDLSKKAHYWYLRDRMGSTAAVVDADGRLLQTTGYYASGTPYRLPSSVIQTPVDKVTDQLHIGNRWLGHSGLAMYDNTARLHDPLLMRFCSPDPLYAKFGPLSPWSHCAADPLNHFDPDGMAHYYNSTGYVGYSGKDDGKIYFIPDNNQKIYTDRSYSAKSSGNSFTVTLAITGLISGLSEKGVAFENSPFADLINATTFELPGDYEGITDMYKEFAQDTGTGEAIESNLREYGGYFIDNKFIKCAPGPVASSSDDKASIYLAGAGNNSTAHSHPSGIVDGKFFLQFPSGQDFNVTKGTVHYVQGMYTNKIYIYTDKGIIGEVDSSNFINWFYDPYK